MLTPFGIDALETISRRRWISNFALNCYWTYSSMFPALSNRQHWWALCPALTRKGERLQQDSMPILFCGYRRISFLLCGKDSPSACFPRCLLQPAIGEDSCKRPLHRWVPVLQHQELAVRRCSPLPDTSGRCRQLAAWHLRSRLPPWNFTKIDSTPISPGVPAPPLSA